MLNHVSAENRVGKGVRKRDSLVQVATYVDLIAAVNTGVPIDPDALCHEVAVYSEIGCLSATNIRKNAGRMSLELPCVDRHNQICNKARAVAHLRRVARSAPVSFAEFGLGGFPALRVRHRFCSSCSLNFTARG